MGPSSGLVPILRDYPRKEWRREVNGQAYAISTSLDRADTAFVNRSFGTKDMHWVQPMSEEELKTLLVNSVFIGVYRLSSKLPPPANADSPSSPRTPSPTVEDADDWQQIGFCRLITDLITFSYLVDVYIEPASRGAGLFSWQMECVDELNKGIPYLHNFVHFATKGEPARSYEKRLKTVPGGRPEDAFYIMTRNYLEDP